MTPLSTVRRWLMVLGALLVALVVVFTLAPGIDLWVSSVFVRDGQGFWIQKIEAVNILRRTIWYGCDLVFASALVMLVVGLFWKRARWFETRVLAFYVSAYVLGPGLIANEILKRYSGRARPRDIAEFGGQALFTPPVQISDQCARNCSFVSGETSAVAALVLMLLLIVVPRLPRAGRPWAVLGGALLLAVTAISRIALGGHFLSDVLFAVVLMGLVVLPLYLAFGLHQPGRRLFTPKGSVAAPRGG